MLMKPEIDDRSTKITTRLGLEEECLIIAADELPSSKVFKSGSSKPDIIIVDEAQFLTKDQIWDLANLVDNWGITVYCYGLKLNWKGEFFSGSETLMQIADELIQGETFCSSNKGATAMFHIKLGGSLDDTVETGFEDMYDTASRKVWREWYNNKQITKG